MRTSQLYNQDKNISFTGVCTQRFENIKTVSNRRSPTTRHTVTNSNTRNPKHAVVLSECGIQYDVPLAPLDVAARRAERLAKEKLKNAVGTVSFIYTHTRTLFMHLIHASTTLFFSPVT